MDVEVFKEDSEGFEFELKGEDHTFINLLTTFLDQNKKVSYAAYKIEHPLVGHPRLFFNLKGIKPSENILIGKIKGVGPKTVDQLEAIGIKYVSQFLLQSPKDLSQRTGIAEKLIAKYSTEARKMVPEDKFGYRAVLKDTLKEMKKTLAEIKESV